MAIAVVAVSGGLMAAKLNRHTIFCTTTTVTASTCPTSVTGTIVSAKTGSGTKVCTAATVNDACPSTGYITALTAAD